MPAGSFACYVLLAAAGHQQGRRQVSFNSRLISFSNAKLMRDVGPAMLIE
jgi:hypothetical protein